MKRAHYCHLKYTKNMTALLDKKITKIINYLSLWQNARK